jgi:hypothetical protein
MEIPQLHPTKVYLKNLKNHILTTMMTLLLRDLWTIDLDSSMLTNHNL